MFFAERIQFLENPYAKTQIMQKSEESSALHVKNCKTDAFLVRIRV